MERRVFAVFIIAVLLASLVYAQPTQRRRKAPTRTTPTEVSLPPRSSDCFFAAPLMIDVPFGPTEPLRGHGFVSEIKPDARVKNVFEKEHNTIWYILDIPYSGKLLLDITPKTASDDYDFLVYKYTDKYFCNRIIGNKVVPIRSVMSTPIVDRGGKTGLSLNGSICNIPKTSSTAYAKYIDVEEGEKYVIVVDNRTDGGLGHTILATIDADFAPLILMPLDSVKRERTTANLVIRDITNNNNLVMEKENVGSQLIKLLPGKRYSISLKKLGYFNFYREVSHSQAKRDSVLHARMVEIRPGASIPIKDDIFFDIDENDRVRLLPESEPALRSILSMLKEYPHIKIDIIGRIATEGLNLRRDAEVSRLRAFAVRDYLIENGIPESNIRARGSNIRELEKQLADQKKLRTGQTINPKLEIKVVSAR